jgi:hypothetical protein
MNAAYKVYWTEYERGWGSRPDGTQVFKTKELANQIIKAYKKRQKSNSYIIPSGPVLFETTLEIDKRLETEDSFWLHVSRHV